MRRVNIPPEGDDDLRPAGRGGQRAHFARRQSGQLRWMIDRGNLRCGQVEPDRAHDGDGFGEGEQENAVGQSRCMVVRSATVIVPRSTVPVVTLGVGMRHAVRMGGDFPVLECMHGMGGGQEDQAGQPEKAEAAAGMHHGIKLSARLAPVKLFPHPSGQRPTRGPKEPSHQCRLRRKRRPEIPKASRPHPMITE